MKKNYTVVIVDDHSLFAQALANLVNTFDNFRVLYTVKNGEEFIAKLKDEAGIPDIAVIDINMPVMNGIETTRLVTKKFPQIRILALSMDDEEQTIISMIRAGAKGYLLKDIDPPALYGAFIDLVEKGFYHSDRLTSTVYNSILKNEPQVVLRDREIEFLRLVCTEMTYKEIASEMFLSPKTIDGYREALFEKLQVKSRVGLAIYAIKNKIFRIE